jgi:hypothetical protein
MILVSISCGGNFHSLVNVKGALSSTGECITFYAASFTPDLYRQSSAITTVVFYEALSTSTYFD